MSFRFVALVVLVTQSAGQTPLRTGDEARQLTDPEIAALEQFLPLETKPWLLDGERTRWNTQSIQAFLPATVSTLTLRRGTVINFERRSSRDPWVKQRTEFYAQVAIAGREFGQIEGDQDPNRPFRVEGAFDDSELIELVQSFRVDRTPSERDFGPIQSWPILSVVRKGNDSAEITLRGSGMYVLVGMSRQATQGWTVVVVGSWSG